MRKPHQALPPARLRSILGSVLVLAAAAATAQAPNDFRLVAQAGAVFPEYPASVVVIDSTGFAGSCRIDPPDRVDGACSALLQLALDPADLDAIWDAVQSNGFFGLDSTYLDTTFVGGSYADLLITGGGQSHHVRTMNTAVPGVDQVIIAVNAFLPPDHQIAYNEILP